MRTTVAPVGAQAVSRAFAWLDYATVGYVQASCDKHMASHAGVTQAHHHAHAGPHTCCDTRARRCAALHGCFHLQGQLSSLGVEVALVQSDDTSWLGIWLGLRWQADQPTAGWAPSGATASYLGGLTTELLPEHARKGARTRRACERVWCRAACVGEEGVALALHSCTAVQRIERDSLRQHSPCHSVARGPAAPTWSELLVRIKVCGVCTIAPPPPPPPKAHRGPTGSRCSDTCAGVALGCGAQPSTQRRRFRCGSGRKSTILCGGRGIGHEHGVCRPDKLG